jgi:hypothetical protein
MRIDPNRPPTFSEATQVPSAARRPFVEVLHEKKADSFQSPHAAAQGADSIVVPSTPVGHETIKKILNQAVDTENKMDQRLREITSGKVYSPSELLALQAEVFRYSQSIETVSRVTDKLVGGLKQILSTQV